MVEQIYNIKNQVLQKMLRDMEERGVDRLDVTEVGKMADIVKDLAEAEKSCWEAEYYRGVSEAMEGQTGYSGQSGYSMGQQGARGGSNGSRGSSGWSNQYGSSRRGYMGHMDLEGIRRAMQTADPQERERMRAELQTMLGQM